MSGSTPRPSYHASRRGVLRAGAALAVTAGTGALLGGCQPASGDSGLHGSVTIELWHGQEGSSRRAITDLIREFHRRHPMIKVTEGNPGVVVDRLSRKLRADLARGSYPDVAYVFGSDLASLTRSPQLVDLTPTVTASATPWHEYWKAARDAVTVDGRIMAAPALLDSLCVVYNRRLFRRAGVPLPEDGWTWDDFRKRARALTDPRRRIYGTGWPGSGDEDTVWRLWPMVWDQGGDVVFPDGKGIAFVTPGELALETVAGMVRDGSLFVDTRSGAERMYDMFLDDRMAMVATGPWMVGDARAADMDYGVVPLPSYTGAPTTISGPDTWAVFDNGAMRRRAATVFVGWLMQPKQDASWAARGGSLPLTATAARLPTWRDEARTATGLDVFVTSLDSARARPAIPAYPEISRHVGVAIKAVLLGRKDPAAAMAVCTERANALLRARA